MEKTKSAAALLYAYKQIETWCNENLKGNSYEVYVLQKNCGVHCWYDFVWSATHSALFLARGDHSRWGALDCDFTTGMTAKSFRYYMFESYGGAKIDYAKLREDGNLVWDEELSSLINAWPHIKERLLSEIRREDELLNFTA